MLDKLPPEIVQLILERTHDSRDLKRLCEVSKNIYKCTVPILYQTVTLRVAEEWELEDFDVEPLLRTCSTVNGPLRYVKHLHFATDFHRRLTSRCGHMKPLFDRLDDNSLKSFSIATPYDSWELGTCLPDQVLTFLSTKQHRLVSLSLVTDNSCIDVGFVEAYQSLPLLTYLRRLSWRVLQALRDFKALANILRGNSEHLEELELDLLDSVDASEGLRNGRARRRRNLFARDVLRLEAGQRRVLFPCLRRLSLSAVSFCRSIEDMASAFNFEGLQTLKLRNCPRDQRPAGNAGGFQPNRSSHVSGAGRAQPLPGRVQAGSVQVSADVLWPERSVYAG